MLNESFHLGWVVSGAQMRRDDQLVFKSIGPLAEVIHMHVAMLVDLFFAMLWFFLFIAWIWVVISVLVDVFRSDDLSGWAKALWTIFIIVVPLLGVLIYLIARGHGMQERAVAQAAAHDKAQREYIQQAAGSASTADELEKLAGLRDSGVLSEDEYQAQKAKLLS